MAIKGWSDSERIPRLGKIAMGVKDDRGIPKAVDYFVVPPEVQEVYGSQPKELDILIPNEDIDSFFPAYLKRYAGKTGLICKGDGQTATIPADYAQAFGQEYGILFRDGKFYLKETGELLDIVKGKGDRAFISFPCTYKHCPFYKQKKCTEVAVLNIILPKVPGILGVYSLDTGSFNSYTNIRNSLKILKRMFGRISFIPLKLKIRMQQMYPVIEGKRIKTTVPVLYIDLGDISFEQILKAAKEDQLSNPIDALPNPELLEVDSEPADEDEQPSLLYPAIEDPQDIQSKTEEESRKENVGIFKSASAAQIKPTTKGICAAATAECIEGPFKNGEICEIQVTGELVKAFTDIQPGQIFQVLIDEINIAERKVVVKNILTVENAIQAI